MDDAIETVELKTEQVREAEAQEHNQTAWQALAHHKRLVFWCAFFAFSAVGWGFDAQVNGAMLSVPQFRITFG